MPIRFLMETSFKFILNRMRKEDFIFFNLKWKIQEDSMTGNEFMSTKVCAAILKAKHLFLYQRVFGKSQFECLRKSISS